MNDFENALQKYQEKEITQDALFGAFEKEYRSRVLGFLLSLESNKSTLDDIYQEFCIRIYKVFQKKTTIQNLDAYIFRLARNTAIDVIRDNISHKTPQREIPDDTKAPGPGPKTEAIDKDIKELINQALDGLPAEYRELIYLRFHAKMSYEDVCNITGLPLSTVHDRVKKGTTLLVAVLKTLNSD
jgi:RNA polymerase sigma-70 factor (ECF subfamily)